MKTQKLMISIMVLLVAAVVLAACSGATAAPTSAPTASAATQAPSSSSLDGKAILEKACQTCHSLSVVQREKMDQAGWTRSVEDMIQKGAVLTEEEKTALIQYLAETYK